MKNENIEATTKVEIPEGYQLLTNDDVVQQGDMYLNTYKTYWIPSTYAFGTKVWEVGTPVIRPIVKENMFISSYRNGWRIKITPYTELGSFKESLNGEPSHVASHLLCGDTLDAFMEVWNAGIKALMKNKG